MKNIKSVPAVFTIAGLFMIAFSLLDLTPENFILRILVGPATLGIIGIILVITGVFRFIILTSRRQADSSTAKELLDLIGLCAKMGADECVIGIEDGACLILAGFENEGPQEIKRFPATDASAFMQAFRDYLADESNGVWTMLENRLPNEVGSAIGTIVVYGDDDEALIISLSYKDGDSDSLVCDRTFAVEENSPESEEDA